MGTLVIYTTLDLGYFDFRYFIADTEVRAGLMCFRSTTCSEVVLVLDDQCVLCAGGAGIKMLEVPRIVIVSVARSRCSACSLSASRILLEVEAFF